MNTETIKQDIQKEALHIEQDMWDAALFMHEHPELGRQEFLACDRLTSSLAEHGFQVEKGLAGLDTAFRAEYSFDGQDSPSIAYLAEYDALPEMGHACGHNLIGAMSVGAGIALSKIRDGLKGRIVVLGTPDEEGGGGKISLINHGAFQDIDAAMMIHPGARDIKRKWNLAAFSVLVEFRGKPAHAAATPADGINALDAMIQLFNSVGLLRQQLTSDVRIHGIITQGGTAANIIPDFTSAKFLIRASELNRTYDVLEKFKQCVRGAALATGATEQVTVDLENKYEPLMTSNLLMDLYAENMGLLGVQVEEQPFSELGGSSDIGNVSQVVPAIHPTGRIFPPGKEAPGHSHEFALAAKSDQARLAMLQGIQALAMCGVDLLGKPTILQAVKDEFQASTSKD